MNMDDNYSMLFYIQKTSNLLGNLSVCVDVVMNTNSLPPSATQPQNSTC